MLDLHANKYEQRTYRDMRDHKLNSLFLSMQSFDVFNYQFIISLSFCHYNLCPYPPKA